MSSRDRADVCMCVVVKFTTFEKAVEMIYKTMGKPKESFSSLQQTGVSFLGGYIAGIGSATASRPAGKTIYSLC